jgi:hypothetical protein
MYNLKEVTYNETGLTKENVYSLIFNELIKYPDSLDIKEIYKIINTELSKHSSILSEQGKASLRRLINSNAVSEGLIYPFDNKNPRWRLTDEGKNHKKLLATLKLLLMILKR